MAFEYPETLKYLDTHEYVRVDEDEGIVTVGITAFAIDQLGGHVWNSKRTGEKCKTPDGCGRLEAGGRFRPWARFAPAQS
jgi:glycine cleavage system H lipoate-binding protein